MQHIEPDTTIDAYSLAVQVIGNAFIARREMVGIEAGEFIDSVFSDASLALRNHGDDRFSAGSALGIAAASIVETLRAGLQRTRLEALLA